MTLTRTSVTNKNLLLGISGGIAAYKGVELARRLVQSGYEVQVVMTQAGAEFVSPLALQAVTGRSVRQDLFDLHAEAGMSHIELAKWADVLLIAPATADMIAKLAHGFADNLLTTLALATRAPILLAPAMNGQMWRHPAVQSNLDLLSQRGVHLIPPETGSLACGDVDVGRLAEIDHILATTQSLGYDAVSQQALAGKKVLITAGPTFEDIDPVRFIANRSSGKMGYALARAAQSMGAEVTLISGPTSLPDPAAITILRVRSAEQMFAEVKTRFAEQDWMIAAAAVADYRVANPAPHKLKKQDQASLTLSLVQNPDIVAWAASQQPRGKVIAFAAETDHLLENAQSKLRKKGVDAVLANWVNEGKGFEQTENHLFLLTKQGIEDLGVHAKSRLAYQVWQALLTQV
jgi:phosphopantothenoylcysteine decarboxylase/phosphopantothenate--cysteine ligase